MTLAALITAALHLAGPESAPVVRAADHAVAVYRSEHPGTRLDTELLVAVGIVESRLRAVEAGHGVGVWQVIPWARQPLWRRTRPTRQQLRDVTTNALWGAKILGGCLRMRTSIGAALTCYNGGASPGYDRRVLRVLRTLRSAAKKETTT